MFPADYMNLAFSGYSHKSPDFKKANRRESVDGVKIIRGERKSKD